jgi:hypothetical protein
MLPLWRKLEVTTDESHGLPPYKTGGPFTSIKLKSETGVIQGIGSYESPPGQTGFFSVYGNKPARYQGGFIQNNFPVITGVTDDYINSSKIFGSNTLIPSTAGWGPTAWARSAPKIEMASGYVFLSESRDIPRMLKTTSRVFHDSWKLMGGSGSSASMAPKKVADHFLNHEFGWAPFLSDLGKFYTAYQNTANYMSQMAHGNDRWKVYRRTLSDVKQVTKLASGTGQLSEPRLAPSTYFRPGVSATWELFEEVSTIVTSSGQFKWYKPEFEIDGNQNFVHNSAFDRIGRQMTMYGLRISPSNVWRATPWTWLIDWGFNVGRNIDRIQETLLDGVVAKYLYLMHHKVRTLVLYESLPFAQGDVKLVWRRYIDVKQRKEADSPYGFDSPWDSLSPMRLAILAALGLSRS